MKWQVDKTAERWSARGAWLTGKVNENKLKDPGLTHQPWQTLKKGSLVCQLKRHLHPALMML